MNIGGIRKTEKEMGNIIKSDMWWMGVSEEDSGNRVKWKYNRTKVAHLKQLGRKIQFVKMYIKAWEIDTGIKFQAKPGIMASIIYLYICTYFQVKGIEQNTQEQYQALLKIVVSKEIILSLLSSLLHQPPVSYPTRSTSIPYRPVFFYF